MDFEVALREQMMIDADAIAARHDRIKKHGDRLAAEVEPFKMHLKLFEPRAKRPCDRCFALRLPADLIGTHLGGIRARVCRGGCRDFI